MKLKDPVKLPAVSFRALLRESLLGYVFWSLFQGLAPMIWFYPLNELEISGYEAFAVFFFTPLLLGSSLLCKFCQNKYVNGLLRIVSVGCIASFQAPTTLERLVILAIGVGCNMVVVSLSLCYSSVNQRSLTFWGLVLGLFGLISSRVWFVSFVPTWWNDASNSVVIALGVIATIDKILSGNNDDNILEKKSEQRGMALLHGLGFGSLLFVTHMLFGEVSLVTRWTVTGFPEPGPMPYPWGAVILMALHFGVLLSPCRHVTESVVWWVVGAGSLAALLYLNAWQGFAGGAVFAVYIASIWPVVVDSFVAHQSPALFGFSAVIYVVEILFSVWTVAYNFVPGGVYTREHTDWLLAFVMITIGLAMFTKRQSHGPSTTTMQTVSGKMPNTAAFMLLLLYVLAGLAGFLSRLPQQTFSHRKIAHPKADFTAAIWTYHFGYDNKGWPSLERTAQLLNNTNADVITLLESDASKPFLGNNDLGMWLGERLGMYVDFGASTKDHTWGNLLLSRYPIVKSQHHLLPSPHGELAPGITATVSMTGHLVDFVVTHMGNDRDVLDRELQAKFLAKELKNAENPVIFLGYVTSSPGSRDYKQLTVKGNVHDIDDTDRDRWCEYILYRGLIKLGYARVSHGGLSDTEVQMAKFRFPEDLKDYTDNTKIEKDPSKVDEDVLFPSVFGGYRDHHNWVPQHWYHMSTPKYFTPKA